MAECPRCDDAVDPDWDVCPACGQSLADIDTDTDGTEYGQLLFIAGVATVALGIVLPWFDISVPVVGYNATVNGFEADGRYIGIAVLITVALGWWRWGRVSRAVAGLVGLGTTALSLVYLWDPLFGTDLKSRGLNPSEIDAVRSLISTEVGLYVTAAGGLAILIGASYDESGVEGVDTSDPPERYRPSDFEAGRRRAIAEVIDDHGVADRDTIIREVYVDHSDGYNNRDAWWADVEADLREDDRVNDTGRGWTLSKK